jgi:hypothetical protein
MGIGWWGETSTPLAVDGEGTGPEWRSIFRAKAGECMLASAEKLSSVPII